MSYKLNVGYSGYPYTRGWFTFTGKIYELVQKKELSGSVSHNVGIILEAYGASGLPPVIVFKSEEDAMAFKLRYL